MGFDLKPIKITLGIGRYDLSQNIRIKQGYIDTLKVIVSFIDKDGSSFQIPSGSTAKVRMIKPDKKKVLDDTENNGVVEGNKVLFDITNQMQAYPGEGALEIILFNGGQTVTSSTCGITIIENVHDDSGIESTDEWLTVINTLAEIEGIVENARQVMEEVEAATNSADTASQNADAKALYANNQGDYAKTQGDYSKSQGDYSKTQGDYAKTQGDYAKAQGQQTQTIIDSAGPIVNQNLQASYADKGALTGSNVQFTTADDGIIVINPVKGKGTQPLAGTNKLPGYIHQNNRTINGITVTVNSDGSLTLNGTATAYADFYFNPNAAYGSSIPKFTLPAGNYKAISTGSDNITIILGIGSTAIWSYGTTLLTKTLVSATDFAWIILRVAAGTTLSNFVVYPQIELGTVSTPYNKHVPPAPDPDYPLQITHLGDSGSFAAGTCGKNICPMFTNQTVNGVSCVVADDGTVTLNGTSTADVYIYARNNINFAYIGNVAYVISLNNQQTGSYTVILARHDTDAEYLAVSANSINKQYTATITKPYIANRCYIYVASGVTLSNITLKPQLELGTTATPYEAYKGNAITVNATGKDTPDGVCDTIDVFNKKKTPNINSITLNGTENWGLTTTAVSGRSRFVLSIPDKKPSTYGSTLRCTHFNPVSWGTLYSSTPTLPSISGHDTANVISIAGAMFDGMTVADFKAFLAAKFSAGNPVIVDYQVASPVPVDINVTPNNHLIGYKGITNVYTMDATQPTFTATAKSELWTRDYLQDMALANKQDKGVGILDANGNELIKFPSPISNAVNEVTISNSVTGTSPGISASGNDTNISLNINSKGTGVIRNIVNGVMSALFDAVASAVNYFIIKSNTTGNSPSIEATGTDTNVGFDIKTKGTGVFRTLVNGVVSFVVDTAASAVNYLTVKANTAGNAPTISATGTDTNIDVNIVPKGTGRLKENGSNVLRVADLSNTDTENNTQKAFSAAAGYSLGQEIDGVKAKLPSDLTTMISIIPRLNDKYSSSGILLNDVTYAISTLGMRSGAFGYANVQYTDINNTEMGTWGYIEYFQHADGFVTVKLYPDNTPSGFYIGSFILGQSAWNRSWKKVGYTE